VHSGEPGRLGLGTGVRTGRGDEWLQLGPVKVFTDGSILGRTAQLSEPCEGCPGYHGYLQEDPESLRRRVLDAYAAGWSLALHAVGDAALDLALDVIEEGVTRHGTRPVPNQVEHGTVVRPDQVARLAGLPWPASYSRASSPRSGGSCPEPGSHGSSCWSVLTDDGG
jgi:predicted amidohydrolase YtcJ